MNSEYKRIYDRHLQLQGIDITINTDYGERHVDEKAAGHYINQDIPTFAFEINYYNSSGDLVGGWFLDQKSVTDWYFLIWIRAIKNKGITEKDIIELEVMMIDRVKLIQAIEKEGLNAKVIQSVSEDIRAKASGGKHLMNATNNMYFFLTEKLVERPLNLVLKKDYLSKLSILHAIVDRDTITIIRKSSIV